MSLPTNSGFDDGPRVPERADFQSCPAFADYETFSLISFTLVLQPIVRP